MTDAARLGDLVGAVAGDRRPAQALVDRLRALDVAGDPASAALGTALFESIFYRLPAYPDDHLPAVASRLYARTGRDDAAFLLAGMASQSPPPTGRTPTPYRTLLDRFQRFGRHGDAASVAARAAALFPGEPFAVEDAPAGVDAVAAKAAALAAAPIPGDALLHALETFERSRDWLQAALLFESAWHRMPPLLQFWIFYRMSAAYEALGRRDASVLMATFAIQLEPENPECHVPYSRLLRSFRDSGRHREAAELCLRRRSLCPEPPLLPDADLAAMLDAAGPLCLSAPPSGRRDRTVIERQVRTPRPWPTYGGPVPRGFDQLLSAMTRPAISVAELTDAEVLIDAGAVAVFGADGAPHPDLSLRESPALLQRRLAQRGGAVEELYLDQAVLISDDFPGPNLCHFLLDHATRIALYRRAGVDLAAATVIGPRLEAEYQRETAARLGLRSYLSVTRRARVRVGRLWVSSNCRAMRHPAHWAAEWAVGATRGLFDLVPRDPPRRLLVSRADSQWRRIGNEAKVAALLVPLGFEVIVPGRLSFAEQIAAFRDATHIVAPHGAGLANILFCAPGTHVLEVFHPHYGTWAYAMLNDVLGLNYASMVGRDALSDAAAFNDPTLPREQTVAHAGRDMRVDMDELRRWLTDSDAW